MVRTVNEYQQRLEILNSRETFCSKKYEFDPFNKLRLASPSAVFSEEILHGNGMAVTSARKKWRGNAPSRESQRNEKEKKERESAAFIKLNVSFPDRAFPECPP